MKKFLVMAIIAAMLTATLSGCTQSGSEEATTTEATTTLGEEVTTEDTSAEDTDEVTGEATDDTDASDDTAADSKSKEILNAIKAVYGEDYVPNMEIDSETLNMLLNITSDQYVSYAAEMPMISAHVDTVIIIEAADGQVDAIEEALNAYRQAKVDDTMQYPSNIARINASKVVKKDNFVAFLMVGKINENMDATEAEAAEYEEAEVQKAVDAFNAAF